MGPCAIVQVMCPWSQPWMEWWLCTWSNRLCALNTGLHQKPWELRLGVGRRWSPRASDTGLSTLKPIFLILVLTSWASISLFWVSVCFVKEEHNVTFILGMLASSEVAQEKYAVPGLQLLFSQIWQPLEDLGWQFLKAFPQLRCCSDYHPHLMGTKFRSAEWGWHDGHHW